MTIIIPTIGRRVHYWPSQGDIDGHFGVTRMTIFSPDQPCDAGVVFVHSTRCVNLLVTDHGGIVHRRPTVRMVQHGDDPAVEHEAVCTWMPYQLEQALKERPVEPQPEQSMSGGTQAEQDLPPDAEAPPTDPDFNEADAWAIISADGEVTKLDMEIARRFAAEHPDPTMRSIAKLVVHAYGLGLESAPSARVE